MIRRTQQEIQAKIDTLNEQLRSFGYTKSGSSAEKRQKWVWVELKKRERALQQRIEEDAERVGGE